MSIRTHGAHIATLDGWRGIAILMVLFDHLQYSLMGRYAHPWMQTGQHGVTIFFVLSGFLITTKLLEGPISLKRFYLRRLFRLVPAAWIYLAALLMISRSSGVSFTTWPEVRACVFFYRNMVSPAGFGIAGHFWSLSLEEQFYLLWPLILLCAGSKICRWLAAAGACSCAIFRWAFWSHYDRLGPNDMSQVRADALLIGCLLALLLSDQRVRAIAAGWSKLLALPSMLVILACIAHFHWLPPLRENIAIAVLISAGFLHPNTFLARALSFKPLAWLGTISYSVYLWQELFAHLGHGYGQLVPIFIGLPIFALASYYWIERPGIRFGARLLLPQPTKGYDPPPEAGAAMTIVNA